MSEFSWPILPLGVPTSCVHCLGVVQYNFSLLYLFDSVGGRLVLLSGQKAYELAQCEISSDLNFWCDGLAKSRIV